jgi:hypothetical protein
LASNVGLTIERAIETRATRTTSEVSRCCRQDRRLVLSASFNANHPGGVLKAPDVPEHAGVVRSQTGIIFSRSVYRRIPVRLALSNSMGESVR